MNQLLSGGHMDKQEIKLAVDMLVETNRYAELVKELRGLIKRQDTLPRRFCRELTPLNALIDLHEKSTEAFGNVIALIESRRAKDSSTSKPDYMRDYMRQRRWRENTALQIEEIERGAPMTPTARANFKKAQMQKWMAARDAYVETHGELTWQEKNDVVMDFWEKVDTQLENHLAQARIGAQNKRR